MKPAAHPIFMRAKDRRATDVLPPRELRVPLNTATAIVKEALVQLKSEGV